MANPIDELEDVSTWARIDLTSVVSGTFKALAPSVMRRSDGAFMMYPGMVHSFHGESESGKSMVLHAEIALALKARKSVLLIDFESDRATVVNRLIQLGAPPRAIIKYLYYINPDTNPLDEKSIDHELWEDILERSFHLAVIDGVTEAFSVFGVSSMDNDDVTKWGRRVPRQIAKRTGAAVAVVDHVTKDRESRGRFAMGAQAKMSYLTGASFTVEVLDPLGIGMLGRISLRVAKDRPGGVRPRSGDFRKSDRTQPIAIAVIDSTQTGSITYTLEPFEEQAAGPRTITDELRLAILGFINRENLSAKKDSTRRALSQRAIVDAVREQNNSWPIETVKKAIKLCETERLLKLTPPESLGKSGTFAVTRMGTGFIESAKQWGAEEDA
ncbi:AAA family ATPase [Arthrobacter sp. TMN-50]